MTTRDRLTSVRILVVALALSGCATPGSTPVPTQDERDRVAAEFGTVEQCRALLDAPVAPGAQGLDGNRIRLVTWNIKKKSLPHWREDYGRLSRGKDLILIQEAALRPETVGALPTVPYWSFAPGYLMDDAVTGVLTMSRVEPLARCSFANTEPLLRTPKATSVTEFGIANSDETLLVVNVHAVNFSLGLGTYRRQFEQIADVLEGHAGPVILSGDLNTWRDGRLRTITDLAERFDLSELRFPEDHRKVVFGHPLDYIYVRGLTARAAESSTVTSSDHNPLTVVLSL